MKQDAITDEITASFRLDASNTTANVVRRATRPALIFRCSHGELNDLYVFVDAYVADSSVQMRFDTGGPWEAIWLIGDSDDALFAPDPSVIMDQLLQHHRFAFRYFPYKQNRQTAIFTIPALTPVAGASIRYCGFDPAVRTRGLAEDQRREAEHDRRDRALALQQKHQDSLSAVAEIDLANPSGDIVIMPKDTVLSQALISKVVARDGRVLTDYRIATLIEYENGRSLSYSGDTLPLLHGVNMVHVFVNGVEADRPLRFVMRGLP